MVHTIFDFCNIECLNMYVHVVGLTWNFQDGVDNVCVVDVAPAMRDYL